MLCHKGSASSLQDGEILKTAVIFAQSTPSASPRRTPRLSAFSGGVQLGKPELEGALNLPGALPVLSLTPSASPSASHPEHTTPSAGSGIDTGPGHPGQDTPPSPPLSIRSLILEYEYEKEPSDSKASQRNEEEDVFCTPAETPAQMESYFAPAQRTAPHHGKSLSNKTSSEWESVIDKFEGMVDRLATLTQQRPASAQRRRGRTQLSHSANSSETSLGNAIATPSHSLPSPVSARSAAASDPNLPEERHFSDSGSVMNGQHLPAEHAGGNTNAVTGDTRAREPSRIFQRSRSNSAPQSRDSAVAERQPEEISAEAFARLFDDTFMAAVRAEQAAPAADVSMSTDRTLINDPFSRRDSRPHSNLLLAQAALNALNQETDCCNRTRSDQGRSWRSDPINSMQATRSAHSRDATTSTSGDGYAHTSGPVPVSRIGPGFTQLPNPELSIFDDPRGSHNILFEYVVEPGRKTITKVLLAATKVKLVEYLTCDAETELDVDLELPDSDPEFVVDFFITYRAFMSSRYLLNLLTLRIRWCFSEADGNLIAERRRILDKSLRVLLFWLHHHADADFSPSRTLRSTLGTFLQAHIISNAYFSTNGQATPAMIDTIDDIMEAIAREKQARRERKQATATRRIFVDGADAGPNQPARAAGHNGRAHHHSGGRTANASQQTQTHNEYLDSGSRPYPFFASARPSLDSIPRPSMTALRVTAPAERTWKSWLFRRRGHRHPSSQQPLSMTAGNGTTSQNSSTSTVSSTGQSTSTRGSGPSLHTSSSGAQTQSSSMTMPRYIVSSGLYRPFVLDYSAHAVAQHFCIIEQQHVVDIPWLQLLMTDAWRVRNEWGQEVAGQVWKAVDRFNAVSTLAEFTQPFHWKGCGFNKRILVQTCYWVATEVFKVDSNEERAAIVEAFIRIAQTLLAYNNYSTLLAILLAFKTVEIDKSVPIWTCVGSVEKAMFASLRNFCNPARGFRKIRGAHERCCEGIVLDWSAGHTAVSETRDVYGAVPFLGIFLNDLAYLEDVDWFLDPFVVPANPSSESLPLGSGGNALSDTSGSEYTRRTQLLFGTRPYRRPANATNNVSDDTQRSNSTSQQSSSSSPSGGRKTPTAPSRLVNVRRATRTAAVVRSFRAFQHPDRAYTGPAIDCGPELDAGVKTLSGVVD
ncbi:hypothetical protein HDU86_000006 [Geranomyces michiganensis]|nr:hypothetical protein HDU86_000006 [Geranomyces michiganensis]